ncbi:hypothetical protein Val02_02380 [Virgisporangium aliadipatigenens]|uniref:Uncharacterized protein n=1 Tax=Virgisporangium aliadipatigenens TaxID=741659 RepID=A0A8J3YF96_9ACTN|nr:hypothetical protein [Virgisporangium aliadipatigenens]GIJ43352.1 hypothetical protein Val02_02380 [Virgisporangium aliadipatigenens]
MAAVVSTAEWTALSPKLPPYQGAPERRRRTAAALLLVPPAAAVLALGPSSAGAGPVRSGPPVLAPLVAVAFPPADVKWPESGGD